MDKFYALGGVDSPFDHSYRFQTSYILSPTVLGVIRLVISLYAFITNIFRLAYVPSTAGASFSYFTNITYWSIAFYFAFAAFHTLTYARTGATHLERWPRILQYLHVLLYTTICVFPFLVTAVYWKLLAPANGFASIYDLWSNVSVHALNSAFALFEILFTRPKHFPWFHLVWVVLFLGGYLGIAYITYATQHFYTYNFLDPHRNGIGSLVAYVFGILLGTIVVFCIITGVIALRNYVFEKLLKRKEDIYVNDQMKRLEARGKVSEA